MPYHEEHFYPSVSDCEDDAYHTFTRAVVNYCKDTNYLDHNIAQPYVVEPTDVYESEYEELQTKPVKNWTPVDVVNWLNKEARLLNICCTELPSEKLAKYCGNELLALSYKTFCQIDSKYGELLYNKLHQTASLPNSSDYEHMNTSITQLDDDHLESKIRSSLNSIYGEDYSKEENADAVVPTIPPQEPTSPPPPPKKKGPGRPKGSKRKKKPEKMGRLWEFLRDLLKDRRYCPSHIAWDNYEEGMFRFVHSDKVAKLWGTKKDNPDMNYEKLSRAMRYYYKSKVLQPVYGRRLVYKFGPTAHGWRVDNPNFAE